MVVANRLLLLLLLMCAQDAAAMMRTIIGVVAHCHNMGVIHRDLKVRLGHGTQGEELQGHMLSHSTALTVACGSFRAAMCSLSHSLLKGFPFLFCFDPPLI